MITDPIEPRRVPSATISSAISVGSSTSVKVAGANVNRCFFYVTIGDTTDDAWVKLQAASVDNDQKGIFIMKSEDGDNFWEMPSGSIYTGEICMIADAGTLDAYVTEY